MSSFIRNTKHPVTGEWGPAVWLDDHFAHHHYGVRWLDDPQIYDPETWDAETNDEDPKAVWDDFFPQAAEANATTTETVLEERGKRYGNYLQQATLTREIKQAVYSHPGTLKLDDDMLDAIDMIAVKLSRIVNGDPKYADNWADIAGYATLVKDRLEGNERK